MIAFDPYTSLCLLESMSYVVISVDRNGVINFGNKAAELTLGFNAHEAVGQHANLVIPLTMQSAHGFCFTQSQETVKEFAMKKDVVLPFLHKSGNIVKLKGHAPIIRGPDGVPSGSAVIGFQVT